MKVDKKLTKYVRTCGKDSCVKQITGKGKSKVNFAVDNVLIEFVFERKDEPDVLLGVYTITEPSSLVELKQALTYEKLKFAEAQLMIIGLGVEYRRDSGRDLVRVQDVKNFSEINGAQFTEVISDNSHVVAGAMASLYIRNSVEKYHREVRNADSGNFSDSSSGEGTRRSTKHKSRKGSTGSSSSSSSSSSNFHSRSRRSTSKRSVSRTSRASSISSYSESERSKSHVSHSSEKPKSEPVEEKKEVKESQEVKVVTVKKTPMTPKERKTEEKRKKKEAKRLKKEEKKKRKLEAKKAKHREMAKKRAAGTAKTNN